MENKNWELNENELEQVAGGFADKDTIDGTISNFVAGINSILWIAEEKEKILLDSLIKTASGKLIGLHLHDPEEAAGTIEAMEEIQSFMVSQGCPNADITGRLITKLKAEIDV